MSDSQTVTFTSWSKRAPQALQGLADACHHRFGLGLDIATYHLAARTHRHLSGKKQEAAGPHRAGKGKRQAAGVTLDVIAHLDCLLLLKR